MYIVTNEKTTFKCLKLKRRKGVFMLHNNLLYALQYVPITEILNTYTVIYVKNTFLYMSIY